MLRWQRENMGVGPSEFVIFTGSFGSGAKAVLRRNGGTGVGK